MIGKQWLVIGITVIAFGRPTDAPSNGVSSSSSSYAGLVGDPNGLDFSASGAPRIDADLRLPLAANPSSESPPPEMRQLLMPHLDPEFNC
jgi:hypothetical protein